MQKLIARSARTTGNAARALAGALLLVAASTAAAENAPATHSLFISLLAGEQHLDRVAGLDDGHHAGIGIGFRFSDRHSLEIAAGRTDTETQPPAPVPANADSRRVDVLWHYFRGATWQPYVLSGAGQDEFSLNGRDATGTFGEFGGGFFRHLAGPFTLRAEARVLYGFDTEAWHGVAALGITSAFGGNYPGEPLPPPELP